ncbi:MAG: cysteine desulfurase family protein [Candidatus Electryonea clarkiae]|nr:cysteine desulfurase family protein [Candidatus Electryonea clarkiae]MDP8288660.1 cysteine desulfurase family protein [Candidatus Electryonea clarkiae]
MKNKDSKKLIYMDHSATTPVDPRVAEIVSRTMLEQWGNPSSRYAKGNEAKLVLDGARQQVAGLLGADPGAIFFTSGGTEADNMAVIGTMMAAKKSGKGNHLITSDFEHSAISKSAQFLEEQGFRVTKLPVNPEGFVEPDRLIEAIRDDTALVNLMHVNNEIGTIQPISEFGAICRERGILFHTDAVQSFGKIPLDVSTMPLDLVSVSSHKIYGPKGIGALYIREGIEIEPRVYGGGQEDKVRTGTENMPGIAGFGEAVRICNELISTEQIELAELRNLLLESITESVKDDILINGSMESRLGANLNLSFPGIEGESLLLSLDIDGIAASSGSACSSGSTEPSPVLLALGLDKETAQSSIRLTLGRSNTREDILFVAERIGYHVNRLREFAF